MHYCVRCVFIFASTMHNVWTRYTIINTDIGKLCDYASRLCVDKHDGHTKIPKTFCAQKPEIFLNAFWRQNPNSYAFLLRSCPTWSVRENVRPTLKTSKSTRVFGRECVAFRERKTLLAARDVGTPASRRTLRTGCRNLHATIRAGSVLPGRPLSVPRRLLIFERNLNPFPPHARAALGERRAKGHLHILLIFEKLSEGIRQQWGSVD